MPAYMYVISVIITLNPSSKEDRKHITLPPSLPPSRNCFLREDFQQLSNHFSKLSSSAYMYMCAVLLCIPVWKGTRDCARRALVPRYFVVIRAIALFHARIRVPTKGRDKTKSRGIPRNKHLTLPLP